MNQKLLIESHFFPCIAYMAFLLHYPEVEMEACENFQKQTYRNRCYIRLSNKVACLSVPVEKAARQQPIKDVRIDYREDWVKDHWRSIQSAYGKAPFFEYYAEIFYKVLFDKPEFLLDLNMKCLEGIGRCLNVRDATSKIKFSKTYIPEPGNCVKDIRGNIAPGKKNRLQLCYPEYAQLFGREFVTNLSVLDLLFCEGPNARQYLQKVVHMNPEHFPAGGC